jgi:hypothetical protein
VYERQELHISSIIISIMVLDNCDFGTFLKFSVGGGLLRNKCDDYTGDYDDE